MEISRKFSAYIYRYDDVRMLLAVDVVVNLRVHFP